MHDIKLARRFVHFEGAANRHSIMINNKKACTLACVIEYGGSINRIYSKMCYSVRAMSSKACCIKTTYLYISAEDIIEAYF